ncbi:hypothetical protein NYR75_02825 [Actinobacillus equuli subsp. haemolyticus]|uniref:Uncharacterized protein n=1 Tax=Actinobacillus equuli subsp. equuli TaxID=202947 RepID=A0A9X4G5N3_ACTEU|nr:hypothetical protein [Actinobacillus equuli]MDE8034630.1 hypothetical protein [Actinobacillus equuli subsp. equuli]MDG4948734.1 hypothetical protein [Actinobacillus equuli subsp. haemolyticus]WGE63775.1 hypothetical protein NYR75_02825 [Actinobacillus equuli subsp. haemolyticus]
MKIDKTILFIAIAIISLVLILFAVGQYLNIKEIMAIFASGIVTSVGWSVSSYLNNRSFLRGEFIKNKDKLTSLIDEYFKELNTLFEAVKTTEQDVEDYISDHAEDIRLKAEQIHRVFSGDVRFLSAKSCNSLISEPLDYFSDHLTRNEKLQQFKKQILAEIDTLYEEWLKTL